MRKKISVLLVITLIATMAVSYFTVDASQSTGLSISVSKTDFAYGEGIEVTVSGLTEDLRSHNLEMRIEKKVVGDTEGFNQRVGYYQYFDIGENAKDENGVLIPENQKSETMTWTFKNDTRKHPDYPNEGLATIPKGTWTIWVLDFTTNKEACNRVVVNVGLPTLSLNKTTYLVNEEIVATYSGFTSDLWGSAYSEIDIFNAGDIVGTNGSRGGYVVYNSDSSKTQSGLSEGTITFPAADTDRGGKNFPLPAGEYFICLRSNNSIVGTPVYFSIVTSLPSPSPSESASPSPSPSPTPSNSMATISIEGGKTTLVTGESFNILWSGLPVSLQNDTEAEVRFYKDGTYINNFQGTMPEGCTGGASEAYIDLCIRGSQNIYAESGSATFPDDSNKGAGFSLPVGKYRVVLANSRCTESSNVLEITVVDASSPSPSPSATPSATPSASPSATPVNPYDITISVDKTTFTVTEGITVSYEGMLESLFKKGDGTWHDVELRLVKGHGLTPAQHVALADRFDYTDLTDNYSQNSYQQANNTYASVTESGSRSFPNEGLGLNGAAIPLVAGDYTLVAYDYSAAGGAKQVSNVLEITVVEGGSSAAPSETPAASATPGAQNKPTGDVSMFAIVALIMACAGASVVLLKKKIKE